MRKYIKQWLRRGCFIGLLACVVVYCIELISRGMVETFAFIGENPMAFLVNVNRMAIMTLPALFFRKKLFVSLLLQLPWLVAALANRLLMVMRGTPFIWVDLQSAGEGMSLVDQYMTWDMMMEIGVFVTIAIILLVLSYKKYEYDGIKPRDKVAEMLVIGTFIICLQWVYAPAQVMAQGVEDVGSLYKNNGFLYSFTSDIQKMFGGGSGEIALGEEVLAHLQEQDGEAVERTPNIVMIQMEALFDPAILEGVTYSEEVIPNLRAAMDRGYSGPLRVRTFCGGTARTEFEVLTAMNMVYTSGGIPYTDGTVQEQGIESMAHLLRKRGYTATALHNHYGNFFDRDKAYSKLGFDTFVSRETMYPIEYENGWEKDEVLLDYIKRVLKETDTQDFIFGVTVGTHGTYPFEYEELEYGIQVEGIEEGEKKKQLEKYIDRVHHLDKVMGELIDFVQSFEEDTILVLYSDHCPNLEVLKGIEVEMQYTTFYTILDNQKQLPTAQNEYLQSYQLYPTLFEMLGISDGMMNKMHQTYWEDADYATYFQGVQQIVLEGLEDIKPTAMQLGLEPLKVHEMKTEGDKLLIKGEGFTESTKVLIDGNIIQTQYISPTELTATYTGQPTKDIAVGHIGMEDKVLLSVPVT